MADASRKRKANTIIDLTQDDDDFDESDDEFPSSRKASKRSGAPKPVFSDNTEFARRSIPTPESSAQQRDDWLAEEVTSTGDFDDTAYQSLDLYGTIHGRVVGIQYYRGQATYGEMVQLRREPGNPYDGNAIRVDNVLGIQIGHIPRTLAAKLAPLLDDRSLFVEGVLTDEKGSFDVPISLKLYGTSQPEAQQLLKARLKELKLPISELVQLERERKKQEMERKKQADAQHKRMLKDAARKAGGVHHSRDAAQVDNSGWTNLVPTSVEPSLEEILTNSVAFNPREVGEVADRYGAGEDVLSKLPSAKQPQDIATKLLPYQLQGLAWMLDRENPVLPSAESTVQLWRRNSKGNYTNIATNFTETSPRLASGGILADDMGLGKTIQVISLITGESDRAGTTLIVSPLSVMSNWSAQIEAHVRKDKSLQVLVYHGAARTEKAQSAKDFREYDVVITTYQTLASEWMGSKGTTAPVLRKHGLYSVSWRRVVLDEGHQIRNPKAKMSQAACALEATSRWVLTGTPIINNLRDLYSHVKFLRLSGGLDQQEVFSSTIIRPLNQGHPAASTLLQALMGTICLRRMKDMKFIDLRLPELAMHKYVVQWLPHEREKYDIFEKEAKGMLERYQSNNTSNGRTTYSHLLEVLLRLRQCCNHWKLAGDRVAKLLSLVEQSKTIELTPQNVDSLRDLLQLSIDSQEDCPVCLDTLHNPVITSCAHVFGGECIERVIETQKKCPMCRAQLEDKAALVQPTVAAPTEVDPETSSSKVEALISILKASSKKQNTKTVVFSQWTSFLDIVQAQLMQQGMRYCRLDGTMNASQRDAAMDALANDEACGVMLASLQVCSVGLNLNAANQVVLADSWWAAAIEDQAVDRVHRLGQQRPVTVLRLVMENSIEERVLEVQQGKRELARVAFRDEKIRRGTERNARMADIEKLLK